ncbi:unnamed protein product [Amoebophrya sp. A25]|nr:unnamed protein product [Amoebophrya sp. A25]|eukprot:GSA25T00010580001.1
MAKQGTAHMSAAVGDIAEVCLVPGDPLRAKYVADNFLENAKQVTSVRNMLGFTGTYNGVPVSVIASGMGAAGASIYFSELIDYYKVKKLIRIGSCGTMNIPKVKMGDLIIAMTAGTDSNMQRSRLLNYDHAVCADWGLLEACVKACREHVDPSGGETVHVGKLFTSDFFYHPLEKTLFPLLKTHDYLGIEMECSALYAAAAERGAKALCLCTVTDEIHLPETPDGKLSFKGLSATDREQKLRTMLRVGLETAIKS